MRAFSLGGHIRLTYTTIWEQYLRNIGQANISTSDPNYTSIKADFDLHLGMRYQMILSRMKDYMTQKTKTASTVANQQYYHYPVGIRNIEGIVVTIGNVNYPTTICSSQWQWNWLNALQVQPTAIPQFIFPRRDDFGIYPTPKDVYTMTFNYHYRDKTPSIADYTTGTVTVANGSVTVTGDSTVWTSAMAGRFLTITDPTNLGQGYWYRITSVESGTSLTLETGYDGTAGATLTYKIGESPEIPEEGHILLVDGPTADFYSGNRHDVETSTWFNNKFYTGDGQNSSRNYGDDTITGGLIGLYNNYTDRNSEVIIDRKKNIHPFMEQNWGMTLSE